MNFCLPVIVSDMVGCTDDLVKENVNGFILITGKIKDLSNKIKILINNNNLRNNFTSKSIEIVNNYSY